MANRVFNFALILVFCTALPATLARADEHRSALIAIVEAWLGSPHAMKDSEAFRHWDEDGAIPERCATCHSSDGYRDFIGSDDSAVGSVEKPALPVSTVDCATCHNAAAEALTQVTFPSGAVAADLESSSRCGVCHQGRSSTPAVNAAVQDRAPDVVDPELSFINPHYAVAAATLLGSSVSGGYEYDGSNYSGRFNHVPDFNNCADCHDPHSLEIKDEGCNQCHGSTPIADIRMSSADHDGDGDTTESVRAEIEGLHEVLLQKIRSYATTISQTAIAYSSSSYPYFFTDTNDDGLAGAEEAEFGNRYARWTPRLLKAAYNYKFVESDAGSYAHNPRYVIELLQASISDLSEAPGVE